MIHTLEMNDYEDIQSAIDFVIASNTIIKPVLSSL